jgi:hypothetical protein
MAEAVPVHQFKRGRSISELGDELGVATCLLTRVCTVGGAGARHAADGDLL